MNQRPTLFSTKLFGLLQKAEIVLWLGFILGLLLYYRSYPSRSILIVSLSGLAIIFFLGAYMPSNIERKEDEKLGLSDLIYTTVAPKALGISLAVACVGILFYFINSNPMGTKQMLILGGFSTAITSAIILIGVATNAKNIKEIIPNLYRALPLMAVCFYLLSVL
jgi:hypothetical protein